MITRFIIFSFFLITLSISGVGQTWNRDYGVFIPGWAEIPSAIETTNDSLFVIYSDQSPIGGRRLLVSNLDLTSGDIIWTKIYTDSLVSRAAGFFNSVDQSPSGDLFVLGELYETWTPSDPENNLQAELVIFNASFDTLTTTIVGDTNMVSTFQQTRFLDDGSIVSVGNRQNTFTARSRIFLAKFSQSGDLLWTNTHNSVPNQWYASGSLAVSELGNIFVGGYKRDQLSVPLHQPITKFNSDGDFVDEIMFGGEAWLTPGQLFLSPSSTGNILMCTTLFDNEDNGFYLISEIDDDLNVVWENYIPAETTNCEIIQVKEMSDHLLVLGRWVNPETGYEWGLMIKLDLNGQHVWTRKYQNATEGFTTLNRLVDAIELPSNQGYVAIGERNDIETGQNIWVIRLDEFGCLEAGCDTISNIIDTDIESELIF
ncbi:MAG: hypothetical protein ACPGWM_04095, partial [Flavobacteriales bacterium]